jgi:hypothetical protein
LPVFNQELPFLRISLRKSPILMGFTHSMKPLK